MRLNAFLVTTLLTLLPGLSLANESSDSPFTVSGTGGCKPHTWDNDWDGARPTASQPERPRATPAVPRKTKLEAGDVSCRYEDETHDDVDLSTCQKLADRNRIGIAKFYELNPVLMGDCGRIRPYTQYCVAGWIEPLRAYDGFCGPLYNNATCQFTGKECCNRETWTCGNRGRDCTPSLCYREAGSCQMRVVESTDGVCGVVAGRHTVRTCGRLGDCCNLQGRCGSGPEYCGRGICQLGKCSEPDWPMDERPAPLPWEFGEGLP